MSTRKRVEADGRRKSLSLKQVDKRKGGTSNGASDPRREVSNTNLAVSNKHLNMSEERGRERDLNRETITEKSVLSDFKRKSAQKLKETEDRINSKRSRVEANAYKSVSPWNSEAMANQSKMAEKVAELTVLENEVNGLLARLPSMEKTLKQLGDTKKMTKDTLSKFRGELISELEDKISDL